MRILAITNLYPTPLSRHRGIFNQRQFAALSQKHQVRVICPVPWTSELRSKGRSELRESERRTTIDGIEVEYPRFVFTPKVGRRTYGPLLAAQLRGCFGSVVANFRPDIVLGAWLYPDGWAAVELAHSFGLPVAVKAHGSDILHLAEVRGRRKKTRQTLRSADAVIVVSQSLRDRAIELGADACRVRVVENGLDASIFYPGDRGAARGAVGLQDARPVVLFVGNLVKGKGVDTLIAACEGMQSASVDFACHIIGIGPEWNRIRRLICEVGLSDRVFLQGSMDQARLADWYRCADVVALPTLSEGRPNVLIEAAACGTPFVASNVGGIPGIAGNCVSRLVTPGDPIALREALVDFLGAPRSSNVPRFNSHQTSVGELAAAMQCAIDHHASCQATIPVAASAGLIRP